MSKQRIYSASTMGIAWAPCGFGWTIGSSTTTTSSHLRPGLHCASSSTRVWSWNEKASPDLEQLWRRILLSICVSNTDDHLRNHGFMLGATGWALAPAYDMNPDPRGAGLKLNISETDNVQDLDLALSVASVFRVKKERADEIVGEVTGAVNQWRSVATGRGISRPAQDRMRSAFRVAEAEAGGA